MQTKEIKDNEFIEFLTDLLSELNHYENNEHH